MQLVRGRQLGSQVLNCARPISSSALLPPLAVACNTFYFYTHALTYILCDGGMKKYFVRCSVFF
jgi:hypothetical protein